MNTAYWNEPVPLKRQYPGKTTWIEFLITSLGVICGLIGLCIPDPSEKTHFHGPIWMMIVITIGFLGMAALLIWGGHKIGVIHRTHLWKKAFLTNNADLKLDLVAIKKVMRHLQKNTDYTFTDFDDVAVSLALSLRANNPHCPHATYSWEVLCAYRHFAFGEGELPPTSAPKMTGRGEKQ